MSYDQIVRRFEIIVRRPGSEGAPGDRHFVLGRLASALGTALAAIVAIGVVALALVLGYLIAGLMVAGFLVIVFVSLVRSAFRSLRR